MRWYWGILVLLGAVGLAAPATAQERLGDVAGSIELKNKGDAEIVIDQRSVRRSRSASATLSDGEALLEATEECVAAAKTLNGLLGQTGSGTVFYDDGWRARVESAGDRWEQARARFDAIDARGRYAAPYDTAQSGANATTIGLGILRAAISADKPNFSEAKRQIAEGVRLLESARWDVGVAVRAQRAEEPPPVIDPIAADRSINATCRKSYSESSEGFDTCIAAQKAAIDAINIRNAGAVRLDPAVFNTIRNSCRQEWPDDFVQRNQCEQRQIGWKTQETGGR